MPTTWVVVPTCLPTIVRRCHSCGSRRFHADGRFRVNAHHKLLDAWLLALCSTCGDTTKLTVFERSAVRSVRPTLLDGLHHNDPNLAAELLVDPILLRRNRVHLDWNGAWRLDTGGSVPSGEATVEVSVRFAARIPVRPVRLIVEGLGLPRARVESLVREGRLTSGARLDGKRSGDFAFTLTT